MNHSLMEHLMVCYCHELDSNWESKQLFKKMAKAQLSCDGCSFASDFVLKRLFVINEY